MGTFKTKVVYKPTNLVYNIDMIEYFEEHCTVDFTNGRFILLNSKYQSEQIISLHQAAYFNKQGFRFTDIAKNELEEEQAQEWYDNYIGDDETYSKTNAKTERPF